MSDTVREILEGEGIEIHLQCRRHRGGTAGAGVRLDRDGAASPVTVDGSHLLLAVGRLPNTEI